MDYNAYEWVGLEPAVPFMKQFLMFSVANLLIVSILGWLIFSNIKIIFENEKMISLVFSGLLSGVVFFSLSIISYFILKFKSKKIYSYKISEGFIYINKVKYPVKEILSNSTIENLKSLQKPYETWSKVELDSPLIIQISSNANNLKLFCNNTYDYQSILRSLLNQR